jgi:hypothetical protein
MSQGASHGVDLHVHTAISDGLHGPAEVVEMARTLGLGTIAITDHDALEGIAAAQAAAQGTDVEVLSGVELSADVGGLEIHILGYLMAYEEGELPKLLQQCRDWRLERARSVIGRLDALGIHLDWERVQELAGDGAMGRPHIARALCEKGHVDSVREAFERYLGRGCLAWVERPKLTPAQAIAAIRQAHDVPVLAHPWGLVSMLPNLVELGLAGLEVYYPGYEEARVGLLREYARRYDLVCTGGSDFHAVDQDPANMLGGVFVPEESVSSLRREAHALATG